MKYKSGKSEKDMDSKFKDEYCYSPEFDDKYDYKTPIGKEFHLMGTMSEPKGEEDDEE